MAPSQHQKLIAARLKKAMKDRPMDLKTLAAATGLTVSQLGNYRTGLRLMKPWDAKTIATVLGVGAAFLLCIDDPAEERLIRDWRALPEKERNAIADKLESEALAYRSDTVPDGKLQHLSAKGKRTPARASAERQK